MNRRDFLRGVIVLAPAVILTPGLLMRVKPIVLPNEEEIVRLLTETNDILRGMPFHVTVRTGLPSAYWHQLQDAMWPRHPCAYERRLVIPEIGETKEAAIERTLRIITPTLPLLR